MAPTARAAIAFAAVALVALVVPPAVSITLAVALAIAVVVDALAARRELRLRRSLPSVLARGRAASLTVEATAQGRGRVVVRQPVVPDVDITPSEAPEHLDAR